MTQSDTPLPPDEPAQLKWLRRLVTVLTIVMIGGLMIIVALFVIRFSQPMTSTPALPAEIALPAGETLTDASVGSNWTVLITRTQTGSQRLHLVPLGKDAITQSVDLVTQPQ